MRRTSTSFVLALALGLVMAACSNGGNQAGGNPTVTPTGTTANQATETPGPTGSGGSAGTITIDGEQANDHGTRDVAGQDELEIELDDFSFDPTIVRGTPGEQITVDLANQSGTLHNFSIAEQNIDQDVAGGQDQAVTVTIPQSGQVVFFCKYHRALGMLGALQASG